MSDSFTIDWEKAEDIMDLCGWTAQQDNKPETIIPVNSEQRAEAFFLKATIRKECVTKLHKILLCGYQALLEGVLDAQSVGAGFSCRALNLP